MKRWTDKEIKTLRDNHQIKSPQELCGICQDKKVSFNCDICSKALCYDCRTFDNLGRFVDYDGTFCQQCWNIGASYRKLESEAQEVFDKVVEDIWDEWKKEALNT